MNNYTPLTKELQEQIKDDLIFGYYNKNGEKQYPTVKNASEHYNISYESLRKITGKWNWKQKRQDHINKVNRKVQEKKKSEEISETEAEEIVVDDVKFNKAAVKLRRAAVQELDNILNGNVTKSVGYHLMNCGKALESAQKISKTAAGEPSEISKVEGIEQNPVILGDPEYIQAKKRAMDDYYNKSK